MIRRLALALLPLLLAGPAGAADGILPGYWETTNRLTSPIPQKSVEMRCITPKDVAKFMEGPSNRHYACTYPTRSFEGGKILLKGQCVSKKGRKVDVSGEGEYTPTTMKLNARIATEFAGLTISGRATTDARRLSDTCPPPAAAAPAAAKD
ncbi:MAG: DUF3617 family protein [Phenylobacterium sp.]